jgi:hypothetical protein
MQLASCRAFPSKAPGRRFADVVFAVMEKVRSKLINAQTSPLPGMNMKGTMSIRRSSIYPTISLDSPAFHDGVPFPSLFSPLCQIPNDWGALLTSSWVLFLGTTGLVSDRNRNPYPLTKDRDRNPYPLTRPHKPYGSDLCSVGINSAL